MNKQIYKPKIKKFLGKDVRVIEVGIKTYIVVKDVFGALGRLRPDNQLTGRDRDKLNRLLKRLQVDVTKCTIDFGKKKGLGNKSNGSIQKVDCIPRRY